MGKQESGEIKKIFVDCHGTLFGGRNEEFRTEIADVLADLKPDIEIVVHSSEEDVAQKTAGKLTAHFQEMGLSNLSISSEKKRPHITPNEVPSDAVYIDDQPKSVVLLDAEQSDKILDPRDPQKLEESLRKLDVLLPLIG